MAEETERIPSEVQVKVHLRVPSRMPSVYAHHMAIQQGPNEVLISFFEVMPPVLIGVPSEEKVQALLEGGVTAECVARVTVAKEAFPGFAKAMQDVVEQLAAQGAGEIPDAEDRRDNPKG